MPTPITRVDDGDFSILKANGPLVIAYPFIEFGDQFTWEATGRFRVAAEWYKPLPLLQQVVIGMKTGNLSGYVLDWGKAEDVGGGLVEFPMTFGNLPVNRVVGETMTAIFQARKNFAILYSFSKTTLAQVLTEYSLGPLPVLLPPVIATNAIGQIVAYGSWNTYTFTQNGQIAPASTGPIFGANVGVTANPIQPLGTQWNPGDILVGQESKCDTYKAGIYYRETWFVTQPNIITLQGQ